MDDAASHHAWMEDIIDHYHVDKSVPPPHGRSLDLDFPIIADPDRQVANLYGMIDVSNPNNLTIRCVFIINPDHRLRLQMNYPASVGRNFDEIIRCVQALQLSYQKSIATPANWPDNHTQIKLSDGSISNDWKGSVFLLPTVSTEQAFLNYPKFHTCEVPSQKKYLRLVQAEHVGVDPTDLTASNTGSTEVPIKKGESMRAITDASTQTETGEAFNHSNRDWVNVPSEEGRSIEVRTEQPWKWPWENDEPWKWPWEHSDSDDHPARGSDTIIKQHWYKKTLPWDVIRGLSSFLRQHHGITMR